MGICASCLGLGSNDSGTDSENQHLLADPFTPHYGTGAGDSRQPYQVDAEEIRRQRDALERLCAQTSDKLIDVAAPAVVQHPSDNTQDGPVMASRMTTDYPRLFAEKFGPFLAQTAAQVPLSRPQSQTSATEPSNSKQTPPEDVTAWLGQRLGIDLHDAATWKTEGVKDQLSYGIHDAMPS